MKTLDDKIAESIVGAAFKVSNTLGCGFVEKVYENSLGIELKLRGHKVQQQAPVEVRYEKQVVGLYQPDLIVDGQVIVELKAVPILLRLHRAQCMNYLRATGLRKGLIINFGLPRVDFEKISV